MALGLAICATAAIAIAGCGGGGDSTTASTGASGATGASGTPLSQDEFVSQANTICADLNDQLSALQQPTDIKSVADFAAQGLAIIEPAFQQFQALVPPADLQAQWDDYISQAESQLAKEKQLATAAAAGDSQQVQAIAADIKSINNDQDAKATDLGLTECAKDAKPQG